MTTCIKKDEIADGKTNLSGWKTVIISRQICCWGLSAIYTHVTL